MGSAGLFSATSSNIDTSSVVNWFWLISWRYCWDVIGYRFLLFFLSLSSISHISTSSCFLSASWSTRFSITTSFTTWSRLLRCGSLWYSRRRSSISGSLLLSGLNYGSFGCYSLLNICSWLLYRIRYYLSSSILVLSFLSLLVNIVLMYLSYITNHSLSTIRSLHSRSNLLLSILELLSLDRWHAVVLSLSHLLLNIHALLLLES